MRVILFLLKCVVGVFATIGLLVVVAGVVLGVAVSGSEQWETVEGEVPETAVLTLDFSGGIIEARPDNPLSRASLGDVLVVRDSLEALAAASRDPRVKGLVAHVGRGPLNIAQVQELRGAIRAFREQGKFTVAFAETFGEAGDGTQHYYLASAFGEVWMQPSGDLDLTGLLLEQPFLRGALDKLGVEPQLRQREEFKGVMNLLTDSALPEPQRQNLQRLLDSWLGQIAAGVAEARKLEPDRVRGLIDSGPHMASAAVDAGLVDQLGYWDQVEAVLEERAGEDMELVSLGDYDRFRDRDERDGPVVGLVYGLGPVVLAESEDDPAFGRVTMGADTVARAIADAVDDGEVEAIVFRVDSPGGSYVASDTIWREVKRARDEGKPVIVSMGALAASGGYFVVAPAETILALPGTVTGSIGVVAGKLVAQGLWEKLGIRWDGVQAGDNAAIWSPNRPFAEDEWQHLESRLDATYGDFTRKVAEGREMPLDEVLKVAKGQVWTGEDARDLGLVDRLGGLHDALALAAEAAGAEPGEVQIRRFPRARDPVEAFLEDVLGAAVEGPGILSLTRAMNRLLERLGPLVELAERLEADPRSRTLMAPGFQSGS